MICFAIFFETLNSSTFELPKDLLQKYKKWKYKIHKTDKMEAIEHNTSLNSLLVDALPYIDHGYDEPGVREAVRFWFQMHT